MSEETHFIVGLPEENHWSRLIVVSLVHVGKAWLVLAITGHDATSVGKSLLDFVQARSVQTESEFYQLLTRLQHIALDNKVKLSLASATLLANRWTFFGLNAVVQLCRESGLRPVLTQSMTQNQLVARSGHQRLGDRAVLLTGSGLELVNALTPLLNCQGQPSLARIEALFKTRKLYVSATCTLVNPDLPSQPSQSEKAGRLSNWFDRLNQQTRFGLTALRARIRRRRPMQVKLFLSRLTSLVSSVVQSTLVSAKPILPSLPQKRFRGLKRFAKTSSKWLSNIPELPHWWRQKWLLSRSISQSLPKRPRPRVLGVVALVLAGVTLVAIGVFWRLQLRRQQQQIHTVLAPFEQQLAELEKLDETQLPQARDQALRLVTELKTLKTRYPDNSLSAKQVVSEIETAQAFLDSISGKKELATLPVYLDVSQFAADFVISDAIFIQQKLWLLDQAKKALIIYDPQVGQTHQQALISLDEVRDMAVYQDRALLLDDSIYTLTADPTANPTTLITSDEFLGSADLVASFHDFVYIYSASKADIFRYGPDFNAKPKSWLKTILGGEHNQVVSWVIDGDVWLTTKTGRVDRYRAGKRVPFTVTGLNEEMTGPIYMTTRPEVDSLYILVPDQHRVVELNKQGEFIREVNNFVLGSATGLVYDTTADQLLAVSGSVVYQVPF